MKRKKGPSYFIDFSGKNGDQLSLTHDRLAVEATVKLSDFMGLVRSLQRSAGLEPPTSPAALRAIAKTLNCRVSNLPEDGRVYKSKRLEGFTAAGRSKRPLTVSVGTICTGGQMRPSVAGGSVTPRTYDPADYSPEIVAAAQKVIAVFSRVLREKSIKHESHTRS